MKERAPFVLFCPPELWVDAVSCPARISRRRPCYLCGSLFVLAAEHHTCCWYIFTFGVKRDNRQTENETNLRLRTRTGGARGGGMQQAVKSLGEICNCVDKNLCGNEVCRPSS